MSSDAESIYRQQIQASIASMEASLVLGPDVSKAAKLMANALGKGQHLYACGNGGSAADASHFTTELLCRLKDDRPPLPAVALTADSSFLTATSNDYGYDEVFARQVRGLGKSGDVLVAISTSGDSTNIKLALEMAKEQNMVTVSLLGREGGLCAGLADAEIIVPCQSTARIQEVHQVIIHTLCLITEHTLFDMPNHL